MTDITELSSAVDSQNAVSSTREYKEGKNYLLRPALLLVVLGLSYALYVLWWFPKWTVDDAYITYRYSKNLVDAGQLTWNVGEDPIEGYTGILLPLLLALVLKLRLDVDLASKAIGVISFLAGGGFVFAILRSLDASVLAAGCITLLYYFAPMQYSHALSGLETSLFTLFVLASIYSFRRCLDPTPSQHAREIALFALLLLTSLTRPEGVVLAATVTLCLLVSRGLDDRKLPWGTLARFTGVFLLPAVVYFGWRWSYYGQLMPNTYYAKSRALLQLKSLHSGTRFFREQLLVPIATAAVTAAICALSVWKTDGWRQILAIHKRYVLFAAALVSFVAFVTWQYLYSALRMNYSSRFWFHLYPVCLLLVGMIFAYGVSLLQRSARNAFALVLCAVVLPAGIAYQAARDVAGLYTEATAKGIYLQALQAEGVLAGKYLLATVPPDQWAGALLDSGAIPYYSGLKTVDFGGLNDEFLSKRRHVKITRHEQADYLFSHNPGALTITSYNSTELWNERFATIYEDPRWTDNYTLVRRFTFPMSRASQFVYLRNDLVSPSTAVAEDTLSRRPAN